MTWAGVDGTTSTGQATADPEPADRWPVLAPVLLPVDADVGEEDTPDEAPAWAGGLPSLPPASPGSRQGRQLDGMGLSPVPTWAEASTCPDEPSACAVPITVSFTLEERWLAGTTAASAAHPLTGAISSEPPAANSTRTLATSGDEATATTATGSPSAEPSTSPLVAMMARPPVVPAGSDQADRVPTMPAVETSA